MYKSNSTVNNFPDVANWWTLNKADDSLRMAGLIRSTAGLKRNDHGFPSKKGSTKLQSRSLCESPDPREQL